MDRCTEECIGTVKHTQNHSVVVNGKTVGVSQSQNFFTLHSDSSVLAKMLYSNEISSQVLPKLTQADF